MQKKESNMAKKKEENKVAMTRAQKTEATKGLIKELLAVKPLRHNELIEETAKLYIERFKGEDTENVNDVKGRAGSVLDIMQKDSEVMYEGGMYALKSRIPAPAPTQAAEEKPKKTRAKKTVKADEPTAEAPAKATAEVPAPKKRGRKPKAETEQVIVTKLTPPSVEPEKVEKPLPEKVEEAPTPKKRGRKPKAKTEEATKQPAKEEVKREEAQKEQPVKEEKPLPKTEEEPKKVEPKKEETSLVVQPKAEVVQKDVMDMSFLIGVKSKPVKEEKPTQSTTPQKEVKEEKQAPVSAVKTEEPKKPQAVKEEKAQPQKPEAKTEQKAEKKPLKLAPQKQTAKVTLVKKVTKPLTADEKLREAFLKRMRTLGGDYFEYYSVYLLERYSMKNGRCLEGMKISGGDHDGGIDGEIELTDKFGFKETIYIQSKNWDPDKGKEENWVVGETLLQQFIGACACRQAKDRKLHARGIFVTTSRFTPEAKRILEDMSDKIVGYDGEDLFEAAKECSFGVIKKNGEWVLDEKLLSGTKAFFNML